MAIAIGPLYVRRALYIDKQPASIWQKFETLSGVNSWYGLGHTIDSFVQGANGSIELSVDIDNVRARFGGPTLCWQPGSEWSYQNNWLDEDSPWIWPIPTFTTFRLTALYSGTLVELLHHGFERLGTDAGEQLQAYENGWDARHLSALRRICETE